MKGSICYKSCTDKGMMMMTCYYHCDLVDEQPQAVMMVRLLVHVHDDGLEPIE